MNLYSSRKTLILLWLIACAVATTLSFGFALFIPITTTVNDLRSSLRSPSHSLDSYQFTRYDFAFMKVTGLATDTWIRRDYNLDRTRDETLELPVDMNVVFSFGFPCKSSSFEVKRYIDNSVLVKKGTGVVIYDRAAPLQFHFVSWILNVFLYFIAINVVAIVIKLFRLRFRASRGLCHKCAYPHSSRSTTCPECGVSIQNGIRTIK
jgi:hypothetical protein